MLPEASICNECYMPKWQLWDYKKQNGNITFHETRYEDGAVRLRNHHIEKMDQDILYHLALGSGSHDLEGMFGDVRFVCMGGTPKRMEQFAFYLKNEINYTLPAGATLMDISQISYRYSMYKVGPVLCISHGMGIPSISILLHEIIKLLYHARCKNPVIFRMGTCGGIGVEPGTVAITESVVDGLMRPYLELPVLGKLQRRPALLDKGLVEELKRLQRPDDNFKVISGKTMCTYDFYEGQARIDGAFCEYNEHDKMEFLESLSKEGIINMEMESLGFAAICHHAGLRAAVVCSVLVDRLCGDQIAASKDLMAEYQLRPARLLVRYIKQQLKLYPTSELPVSSVTVRSVDKAKLVTQESENYE